MATESNLQKIHIFPSEESYEQNQGSIGADDIAFVPDDSGDSGGGIPVIPITATSTSTDGGSFVGTVPGVTELTDGLALIVIPGDIYIGSRCTLKINDFSPVPLGFAYAMRPSTPPITAHPSSGVYNFFNVNTPQLIVYSSVMNAWVLINQPVIIASDIQVKANTEYTANQVRGIALQTSAPSSIPNGCIVGVYST